MGRRIVLLVVAALLALAGTGAVFAYVSDADARALAKEQPVSALVAAKAIPAGTHARDAIDQGLIVSKQFAKRAVPAGALTNVTSLAGLDSLGAIYPGEIIMSGVFGTPPPTPVATELPIPVGKLVVTVQVDDPMRVGGFLKPGSEVAIFDTFNSLTGDRQPWTPSGDGLTPQFGYNRATRLLLDRVTVLAVGQTTSASATAAATSSPSSSASPTPTPTATADTNVALQQSLLTLAVSQEQAQKLIQGAQTGALYFALLNNQSKVTPGPGIDNRHLFGEGG